MKKLLFLLLLLSGTAFSQQPPQCGGAPCTPFMPYQQPPYPNQAGLWVQTASGSVNINNVVETIPVARIAVAPNTTTYIYLDLTQGVIGTNTSGFISGQYPIASASTNATIVTTLLDLRPNVFNGGTGGGGGSGSSTAWETVSMLNQTSVVLGTNFTTLPLFSYCWDQNNIPIIGNPPVPSTTTPYTVTFTFSSPQSGYCGTLGATSVTPPPPPPGQFSVSPSLIPFGNIALGTTSAPVSVLVANNTNGTVSSIAFAISGTNASDFALASGGNCGTSLVASSSCMAPITFTPTQTTLEQATLTVTSSAATQTVNLTGTGFQNIPPQMVNLTFTNGNGQGSGNVNSADGNIACGIQVSPPTSGQCSFSYLQGTVVMFTASPSGGSTFVNFAGISCPNPCTYTMNANTVVSVLFAPPVVNAPIAIVQDTNLITNGRFPQAQTAGDLNIIVASWQDASTTISSVQDTAGNTYTVAAATTKSGTGGSSSFVQVGPAIANGYGHYSCTMNHTAGDLVIVHLYSTDIATPTWAISNTAAGYTWKTTATRVFSGNEDQTLFYTLVPTTVSGDVITVAYTGVGFPAAYGIDCVEYSGALQTLGSVLDAADNSFKNAPSSTATMTTTAITTVGTNDMIYMACADTSTGSSGWVHSGSWAFITGDIDKNFAMEAANQLNIGVSTYTPTMTGSTTADWQCIAAPFVSASGGSTPGLSESIYVAPNILASPCSPTCNTVSVTWSGTTPQAAEVTAYEYSGMQTTAVIDPQLAITGFTGSSGTLTFAATNGLAAGNQVMLSGFTSGNTGLNGQLVTVLSGGLSGAQFEAAVTGTGYSTGTGVGAAVASATGSSSSPSSGNTVAGYTNDLLFCSTNALASISAVATGYTQRFVDPLSLHDVEDDYAVGANTYACAPTLSASAHWITELVALKGSAAAPPGGTSYPFTITCSGAGSGVVSGNAGGINATCAAGVVGGVSTASLPASSTISLKAIASPPSSFGGYTGGGCSGSPSCVVTMNGPTTVTVSFNGTSNYSLAQQQPYQVASYSSNLNSVTTRKLPADIMSHLLGNTSSVTNSDLMAKTTMLDCGGAGVTSCAFGELSNIGFMGQFKKASPGRDDAGDTPYYPVAGDVWYSMTAATPSGSQTVKFHAPNAAKYPEGEEATMTIWDQNACQIGSTQLTGCVLSLYHFSGTPGTVFTLPAPSGGCGTSQSNACAISNTDQSASVNLYTGQDNAYSSNSQNSAQFAPGALTIRELELQNSTINHALSFSTDCINTGTSEDGTTSYTFPAIALALGSCGSGGFGGQNANRPFAGGLFFLDYTSTQIASFNLPAWQASIITALSTYGAYVTTTSFANTGIAMVGNEHIESAESWKYYNSGTGCSPSNCYNDPFWQWIIGQKGLNGTYSLSPTGCAVGGGTDPSTIDCVGAFLANIPRTVTATSNSTDAEGNACNTGLGCYPSGHLHVASSCVAKGYAGVAGGCN